MTGDRSSRKRYWDAQYTAYWKKRVEEASEGGTSSVIQGDPKTEDDSVYERVFAKSRFPSGCGLCLGAYVPAL